VADEGTQRELVRLMERLPAGINSLGFDHVLPGQAVMDVCSALAHRSDVSARLSALSVCGCRDDPAKATAGVAAFLSAPAGRFMHTLVLSGTPIGSRGLGLLATPLCSAPYLTALRLSDCGLVAVDVAAVVEILVASSSIRELDLSWNEIGDDGFGMLLRAFSGARVAPMVKLQLCHVGVSDASTFALCSLLRRGAFAEEVDLSHNGFGVASGEVCCAALSV
jgi:Ran GTPase-activating protein (RanGAP) involved in mRNA processing and transport